MYTISCRFYSQSLGLLVYKKTEEHRSLSHVIRIANLLMRERSHPILLAPLHYPNENTHRAVTGQVHMLSCRNPTPCNIQIRENGKLIPWRNI